MLRALAAVAALALAAPALAAPPRNGVVVPGRTLGGLALGATEAQVTRAWGPKFGVCRNCEARTLYFNVAPFNAQGAGVELRRGRAVALFTHWAPPGWRTNRGLKIGDAAARITSVYGPLTRVECGTYYALTLPARRGTTIFYVYDEKVWGFGLSEARVRACR